jgi:sugar transferase (PEP-CTERM system associated)
MRFARLAGDQKELVMSLDGMSQNGSKPGLSSLSQRVTDIDAYVRRSPTDDSPSARLGRRRRQAVEKQAFEKRKYPRYIPSAHLAQSLFDLAMIGGTQAAVMGLIYPRLALGGPVEAISVIAISTLASLMFLYATGCYRRDALLSRSAAVSRVPTALTLAGIVLIAVLHYGFPFIFPAARVFLSISRCVTIVLIGMSISMVAAIISRTIVRVFLNFDLFRRRILVVGTGQRARHIDELSRTHGSPQEIHFVSEELLTHTAASKKDTVLSVPSIGELADRLSVDEIVVAVEAAPLDSLLSCKARGIPVTEFNTFVERQTGRIELAWLEVNWLIHSHGFQFRLIDAFIKRSMDITLSMAALIISLPVLLVAMLAVRLDSPGPIFYRQERVTRGGRVFWLYKLRSMRTDAEKDGAKWAVKNDSRVTEVGKFLRQTRLDEIPQLWNILKGDMAIVGPRPERPVFVAELSRQLRLYDLRHTVRAGLTGWAQINYHYGASFEDAQRKLEYDLFYIKNFSLLRDLGIMLQTLRVVLWPEGVH